MHETFMAQQIAAELIRLAEQHKATRLTRVVLKVGAMRQVVPELLNFALAAVMKDTVGDGAQFVVEPVPPRCRCRKCAAEFEVERWSYLCPSCGSGDVAGLTGDELIIETVTFETDDEEKEAE
ncbi:MAG: hydrogenase maturation nickel metallochaperone HypA [Phycisphaerae bacterium]|nr:hydrogenase maturation nickel metallochaperone HypA [Phycisphaerae bacterium]